jgi:hypothetical protein
MVKRKLDRLPTSGAATSFSTRHWTARWLNLPLNSFKIESPSKSGSTIDAKLKTLFIGCGKTT